MQDYIGKEIDRYRIVERLGVGGMAVVYKAYDSRLERDVALKLIRTSEIPESQHDRLMKRFEREAKSQARFMHRNIVPVHDYGEVDGSPYLVISYIPGGTLKEKMSGPVDWWKAVRWLIPLAEALAYAHQRGVIHRDVKPSNILFDDENQPILTDFGIAKILETDEATLTGTGLGVGTPEYMAPEQWQGKASPATDQYALGVVLYELITGQKPYTAETPVAVALKQMSEPLQRPSTLAPGIPEGVEKVLYKALARDSGDRYQEMSAFKKALEGLLAGDEVKIPEPVKKAQLSAKPAAIPDVDSEGETRDVLDITPVETTSRKQSVESVKDKVHIRKRLPAWLPWSLLGVLTVVLILVMTLGRGGGDGSEPTAVAEGQKKTTEELSTNITDLLGVGSTRINQKDNAEMVYVPAGEFLMGSDGAEDVANEYPEHTVYVDAFWIYKHEVTNDQFAAFVQDTGSQTDAEKKGWSNVYESGSWEQTSGAYWAESQGPGSDVDRLENYPVIHVSWNDAAAYCEWAGGRLPTEAEWEKAARGEDGRTYPWGNTPVTGLKANYCDENCGLDWKDSSQDDGYAQTAPVGSFPEGASPYGAMDMAGNVWEWVLDWYDGDYYASSPGTNPSGPGSGDYRVLRGGSWFASERYLRASYRRRYSPDFTNYFCGFRCFRSP